MGITERSACAIVTDLVAAGYVVQEKDADGRRNRYQIQAHLPQQEDMSGERTIGEVLGRARREHPRAAPHKPVSASGTRLTAPDRFRETGGLGILRSGSTSQNGVMTTWGT